MLNPGTGILLDNSLFDPEDQPLEKINPDVKEDGKIINKQLDFRTVEIDLPVPEEDRIPYAKFSVRIKNKAHKILNISLLYLGQMFEISADYLTEQPKVIPLVGKSTGHEGQTVWAFGNAVEGNPYILKPFIIDNNWEEETFYLKLLISEAEFSLGNILEQNALPEPGRKVIDKKTVVDMDDDEEELPAFKEWTTKMVAVKVKNPFYKENQF